MGQMEDPASCTTHYAHLCSTSLTHLFTCYDKQLQYTSKKVESSVQHQDYTRLQLYSLTHSDNEEQPQKAQANFKLLINHLPKVRSDLQPGRGPRVNQYIPTSLQPETKQKNNTNLYFDLSEPKINKKPPGDAMMQPVLNCQDVLESECNANNTQDNIELDGEEPLHAPEQEAQRILVNQSSHINLTRCTELCPRGDITSLNDPGLHRSGHSPAYMEPSRNWSHLESRQMKGMYDYLPTQPFPKQKRSWRSEFAWSYKLVWNNTLFWLTKITWGERILWKNKFGWRINRKADSYNGVQFASWAYELDLGTFTN